MQLWQRPDGSTAGGRMPLTARSTTGTGALSLGAVATVVDVAAVHEASLAHGGRTVTTHLALRLANGPVRGLMETTARVLRAGRSSVLTTCDVRLAGGPSIGICTVTGGALGGAGGSHQPSGDRSDFYVERDVPLEEGPSTHEYLAMARVDDAGGALRYRLDFHEPLRNVAGVLHGGSACLIVEHAGLLAAADLGVEAPAADELDVHFLLPGLVGPFSCDVTLAPGARPGGRHVFAVALHDDGRDGRLVAYGLTGVVPGSGPLL